MVTTEDPALRELLEAMVGDGPGGLVALVDRGSVASVAAAGSANAAGDPLSPDTPFRVMSITKTFVATMVLQLADEGRLDLDEPLSFYLPDAILGGDVPVRQLLNHRSGLTDFWYRHQLTDAMRAAPGRVFTPDEVLAYVVDSPVTTPNSHFRYANTNYLLLGQLIERLDGTDLASALRTRITEPLGLKATVLPAAGHPPPENLAASWSSERGVPILVGDPQAPFDAIDSVVWAAGGLISCAEDLARFLTALVEGELISSEMLAEMTAFGHEGKGYGFGLHWVSTVDGSDGYAHDGAGFGYSSFMGIAPARGDVIVLLSNNEKLHAGGLATAIIRL